MTDKKRRQLFLRAAGLGIASLLPPSITAQETLIAKAIPGSGEHLPAVGLGTATVFDVDDDAARLAALAQVVHDLVAGGGAVIDTASTYGSAEAVVGRLVAEAGLRRQVFIATKLERADAAELRQSLQRLRTDRVDLLQLHNVRDAGQSLAQFRQWKAEGICRYVGITSTFRSDYGAVEAVMRKERPDFLQIDYSLDNREAEERLLPLALETKAAVLTALPFGHGRLFRKVRGRALPDWPREFDASTWAQFFLKFLLGHPAVTAVIPGTGDPAHMQDNLGAMRGRLPDPAQRQRMIEYLRSL